MKPYTLDLFILGPNTGVAAEILDRVTEHANDIYVRDVLNGVTGNYRLSELPAPQILAHVLRWVREGQRPYYRRRQ